MQLIDNLFKRHRSLQYGVFDFTLQWHTERYGVFIYLFSYFNLLRLMLSNAPLHKNVEFGSGRIPTPSLLCEYVQCGCVGVHFNLQISFILSKCIIAKSSNIRPDSTRERSSLACRHGAHCHLHDARCRQSQRYRRNHLCHP